MKTLATEKTPAKAQIINHQITELPIDKLAVPLSHPRRDLGDPESLQLSIRRNGLIEPLLVCKVEGEDHYMVIDGSRRLTVLAEFGWKAAPCIILDSMSLAQIAHTSFEKNMERKSLNPIEQALHIRDMQEKYGYSLREMEALGYGLAPTISHKTRLLKLPDSVQERIAQGALTVAHGVELCKLGNAKVQEKMAKQVLDFEWSAKRTGIKVDRLLKKGKQAPRERIAIPAGDIPGVYFKDAKDMSELPDESVHLIVTSPPYCVGMAFEKGISYDEHWENMKAVMGEAARVLVPGGIMALNVGDIHNFKGSKGTNKFTQIQLVGHKYQTFLRPHQVYLTDEIAWVKTTAAQSRDVSKAWSENIPHTGYRIHISHDPVYIFRKKGERTAPSEEATLNSRITKKEWDQWASGIWMINRIRKMEGHPAIFPDELVNRLVRMFSYEGDTVLDPFLGSGTTVKVARELNREGVGYERLPQYKEVIMKTLGIEETAAPAKLMTEYAEQAAALEETEVEVPSETAAAFDRMFGEEAEMPEEAEAA
ncbi:MAG: DNA methyltransferase [Pseudomonadota bacterium]